MMRRLGLLVVLLSVAGGGGARAEVADSSAAGFHVREEAEIHAAPDSVYRALVGRIGAWWDSQHTFSGDAGNLSLDVRPGGCLCERLPGGGGALHLTVVQVRPGRLLRLAGGMGPLQVAGIAGSMTWSLAAAPGGTKAALDYVVGGYFPGGLGTMSGPVDSVLNALLLRLKSYVETGQPVAK
jgi:uncharacterized protein YndB with AHSA1/START domain